MEAIEIFKLFEATVANVQPGHPSLRDLRRDQLLAHYDEAEKALKTLIKAKEREIAYRHDLIDMLDKCKSTHDSKLIIARQAYQTAIKHPLTSQDVNQSTTPPSSPSPSISQIKMDMNVSTTSSSSSQGPPISQASVISPQQPSNNSLFPPGLSSQTSQKSSDLDIPIPSDRLENRTRLDERLSELLKTFPNLAQSGIATAGGDNGGVKPLPGYYTQQPQLAGPTPPINLAMLRFPPPNLIPGHTAQNMPINQNLQLQENHDTADMDLSDDSSTNNTGNTGIIPMVASAMQQGAGGKQNVRPDTSPYVAGQHFNNVQYTHRINPLPFDPSIMEPRLRDSSSSNGSRSDAKHPQSDRSRHSGSSSGSGSGVKHGSDKSKYPSSHSSRKRR